MPPRIGPIGRSFCPIGRFSPSPVDLGGRPGYDKTNKIDVDCANCANKMEEAARKTEGVQSATVNFMALKMIVEFAEGQDPKAVMEQVRRNCKKVEDDCEIYL